MTTVLSEQKTEMKAWRRYFLAITRFSLSFYFLAEGFIATIADEHEQLLQSYFEEKTNNIFSILCPALPCREHLTASTLQPIKEHLIYQVFCNLKIYNFCDDLL